MCRWAFRSQFDAEQMLMFDMIALAYQANLTRIINMMMAAEVSNMTYNYIGVPDAFHPVSHHADDPTKKEKLVKIQTYHTKVRQVPQARCGARRTGTARCSIIRSFCTAAT